MFNGKKEVSIDQINNLINKSGRTKKERTLRNFCSVMFLNNFCNYFMSEFFNKISIKANIDRLLIDAQTTYVRKSELDIPVNYLSYRIPFDLPTFVEIFYELITLILKEPQGIKKIDYIFVGFFEWCKIHHKSIPHDLESKLKDFLNQYYKGEEIENLEFFNTTPSLSNLSLSFKVKNYQTISPKTPFDNKLAIINLIQKSNEFVYWVDKYFSIQGLTLIREYIPANNVETIKILTSPTKINQEFRSLCKDLIKQMKQEEIKLEIRVLIDKKIYSSIHDRYLITLDHAWNIPSPDIIKRGQYSHISEIENNVPFLTWWEKGKDLIEEWANIKSSIN